MKKVLLLSLLFAMCATLRAQSNKEDIEIIQNLYGKDKKTIVESFIQLDADKKDAFWKMYDEYETERKNLGKKRIALLERYAAEYDKMDDAKLETLMKDIFSLQQQTDKLIESYYQKIKKSAGVRAAAQFSQIEAYLLSIVRVTILENIPVIGGLYESPEKKVGQ